MSAQASGTISIFDKMSKPLMQITNAMNIMLSVMDDLAKSMNADIKIGDSINTARSQLAQASATFKSASMDAEKLASDQRKVNDSFNKAPPPVSRFQKALDYAKGSLMAYAGMQGVRTVLSLTKSFVTTADSVTQTKARLDLMNDGLQTTAELQNMIAQSAKNARGDVMDTADAVSKLGITASSAFSGTSEVVDFVEQINKQFKIAGTNAEGQAAAMLQLTQAMGSGVLRGEELNSIFEQAPTIIQSIAKHLDVPIGRIREMASEGEITAQIVKEAMFATADETNAKFESMPKTFSDMTTQMKNDFVDTLQPMIDKFSTWLNSDSGQQLFDDISSGLQKVANFGGIAIDIITGFIEVWQMVSPVVMPVLGALVAGLSAYGLWLGITAMLQAMSALGAFMLAFSYGGLNAALNTTALGQRILNSAMLSCPIFWIVAGIALVIFMLVKMGFTAQQIVGTIVGAFFVAGALIWNIFIGVINAVIQFLWAWFVTPFISIIEWVLNACNGGFDSFGDAVKNLLGQIVSWFLDLGKVVTKIIDAIFGTDWTSGLNSLQKKVLSWGKNEKAITINREAPVLGERKNYGDAFDSGYNFGSGIVDGVSNLFGGNSNDSSGGNNGNGLGGNGYGVGSDNGLGALDSLNDSANKGNQSLSNIEDKIDISNENLELMRDLAEQESIQNFVTLTPTVHVTTGDIKETADIKKIIGEIEDYMTTELVNSAEGVYT